MVIGILRQRIALVLMLRRSMKGFSFAVLLLLVVTACATKRIEVEKPVVLEHVKHDTVLVTSVAYSADTVRIKDSIVVWENGNRDFFHFELNKSVKNTADTVYINKTDTVEVPVEVVRTVEVEKKRSVPWWAVAVVLLGGLGVIGLYRRN